MADRLQVSFINPNYEQSECGTIAGTGRAGPYFTGIVKQPKHRHKLNLSTRQRNSPGTSSRLLTSSFPVTAPFQGAYTPVPGLALYPPSGVSGSIAHQRIRILNGLTCQTKRPGVSPRTPNTAPFQNDEYRQELSISSGAVSAYCCDSSISSH
jgi:hypothetical protein